MIIHSNHIDGDANAALPVLTPGPTPGRLHADVATEIAREFATHPDFLDGARRLLDSSDGVPHEQLKEDTEMFVFGARRSYHLSYEPLLEMEKELYWWIDRRRHAYALRLIWKAGKMRHPILPSADHVDATG